MDESHHSVRSGGANPQVFRTDVNVRTPGTSLFGRHHGVFTYLV